MPEAHEIKIRNIGQPVMMKACDIRRARLNWRSHPASQKRAMRAALDEIGFVGTVLAWRRPDGEVECLDGHMRLEEFGEQEIPVQLVDLDEAEAKKALASHDRIAVLAEVDTEALDELLGSIDAQTDTFAKMMSDFSAEFPNREFDLGIKQNEETKLDLGLDPNQFQASHVRMVQLFLNTDSYPEFQRMCAKLSNRYRTENPTDVVMQCMEEMFGYVERGGDDVQLEVVS